MAFLELSTISEYNMEINAFTALFHMRGSSYEKEISLMKFGKQLNIQIDIYTFKSAVLWQYVHIVIYVYKCLLSVFKLKSRVFIILKWLFYHYFLYSFLFLENIMTFC